MEKENEVETKEQHEFFPYKSMKEMLADPDIQKELEEEHKSKVAEEFIGFLGVIIALVMTIAWEFLQSKPEEPLVILASVWYYLACLGALTSICLFYYFRFIDKEDWAKKIERLFFFPFSFFAIVLGILPIFGLGIEVVWSAFLFVIIVGLTGLVAFIYKILRPTENDSE